MKESKRLRMLCLVLFAVGCSGISVNTDFDNQIDFTKLSTYSWMKAPEEPAAEKPEPAPEPPPPLKPVEGAAPPPSLDAGGEAETRDGEESSAG